MTDAELTAAYSAYADMVYRIAYVQTKSLAQAEDIQQDVFMALVRYSDRIKSEQHLKAWLIRVTQNACKKHFRSLWFRLSVPYDDALFKEQEDDGGGGPVQTAQEEEREDFELVQDMVEELPESYRIVIHLFYYEQLSVREIASAIGATEANVKTRLSRAREKLRKLWEERR